MSTLRKIMVRCAVCGKESEQTIMLSTNQFGASDLDLRPPNMMRSTMSWWIQECPHCGVVSSHIDQEDAVSVEWLEDEAYKTCDGIRFGSSLAQRFYRHYLICSSKYDRKGAYEAVLHAAWACDDAKEQTNAILCRQLALSLLDKLLKRPWVREELYIVKADLLRRMGEFDQLIETFSETKLSNKLLNQIMKFQIARAKEQDDACYTVDDVKNKDSEV